MELDGAIYFITFRLADSLPAEVLSELRELRIQLEHQIPRQSISAVLNLHLDAALDAGAGACWLRRRDLAAFIEDAIRHFDDRRYRLIAWCVMPNHVHALVRIERGRDLANVVHSWKSFTAHRCNAILGRTGRFWQQGYFDRIVRDEADLERVIEYIVGNPASSGLADWPFVGWKPEVVRSILGG
jgi:REP element-mobilizing transposase RayT